MANAEIYDYISTVTPDVPITLNIDPQSVLPETISKNDQIQVADDRSEQRVELSSNYIPYINIRYDILDEDDCGIIIDFYFNNSKGNGLLNSFKFSHPDGHTYVVRFDTDLTKLMNPTNYSIKNIRLKVLGRIAD